MQSAANRDRCLVIQRVKDRLADFLRDKFVGPLLRAAIPLRPRTSQQGLEGVTELLVVRILEPVELGLELRQNATAAKPEERTSESDSPQPCVFNC